MINRFRHTDAMSNAEVAKHMAVHANRKKSLRVPRDEHSRSEMTRRHVDMHEGNTRMKVVAGHVHGGIPDAAFNDRRQEGRRP